MKIRVCLGVPLFHFVDAAGRTPRMVHALWLESPMPRWIPGQVLPVLMHADHIFRRL